MADKVQTEDQGRQPISPAVRQRLMTWFQHGSKSAATGNYDYATEMFAQCVAGDPANLIYAQNFIGNLQKKYNNNKTGGKLASIRGAGAKGMVKKAAMKKDWKEVLTHGWDMLKLNPWDSYVLGEMGVACEHLGYEECQIAYLTAALDADIKDPDINRQCGRALARQGQFDQAMLCWRRVLQAKPNDEEAGRALNNLTVQKTIKTGGYEEAESSTAVMKDKQLQNERMGMAGPKASPEQQLEKAIKKNPSDISKYLELSELYQRDERFSQALEILQQALAVSGGDIDLRERCEDVELRMARSQLAVAEKRSESEKTPEAATLVQQFKVEMNNKELEIYRSRCDRYPKDTGFKFELAVRFQRARKYSEAIKCYQDAKSDLKRKARVQLNLGTCFEHIKQFKLALAHYDQALLDMSDRDEDDRKLALYKAAVLSMDRLKDLDAADKYLSTLAGLDFGYRDVSERLDKLAALRDDGSPMDDV